MSDVVLSFKDICVEFPLSRGVLHAANHVTLDIFRGEMIGLVGESGSGKTTLTSTALNLVSAPGKITSGEVVFEGENILKYSPDEARQFNWRNIAMVFQAAQNSMNPVLRIKDIFMETVAAHDRNCKEEDVIRKATKLFEYVRLDASNVMMSYPHQLSGGMKQRAIIALSLILDPKVLILDEPTTALDVITQAYIMNILRQLHDEMGITMIFSTHDISVIGKIADRIGVMYGGELVELGTYKHIFYNPLHPYTNGLIKAAPSLLDDITKRRAIPGSPPDLINISPGCRFSPRCDLFSKGLCQDKEDTATFFEAEDGHFTRCPVMRKLVDANG